MDLEFRCECGDELSARIGDGPEGDAHVECGACGSVFVVSVTRLQVDPDRS